MRARFRTSVHGAPLIHIGSSNSINSGKSGNSGISGVSGNVLFAAVARLKGVGVQAKQEDQEQEEQAAPVVMATVTNGIKTVTNGIKTVTNGAATCAALSAAVEEAKVR